jgi:tight adherence protein B
MLARADLKMKPGEYIALLIICILGLGMLMWFIGGQSIVLGLVGGIIGYILPGCMLKDCRANASSSSMSNWVIC